MALKAYVSITSSNTNDLNKTMSEIKEVSKKLGFGLKIKEVPKMKLMVPIKNKDNIKAITSIKMPEKVYMEISIK